MAMRVMVVKYGYTVIDTDNEEDAIEQAKNMSDSDFDWSDFDDAQVVDNDVEWDESEMNNYAERVYYQKWKADSVDRRRN